MVDPVLKEQLNSIFQDVKSDISLETMISLLLEKELIDLNQLHFKPLGSFKRGFKKDVDGIEVFENKSPRKLSVNIGINREGLYDMLPEGLFHTSTRKSHHIDTEESVKELKLHKEEEKVARKFFLPLEQEYYRNKILIEQKEQSISKGYTDPQIFDLFSDFWRLPNLPRLLKLNLLYLLPLASKIVGNIDLTQTVFELVLNEPVKIIQSSINHQRIDLSEQLGEATLGEDLILEDQINEGLPLLKILIGPIQNKNTIVDYVSGGDFKILTQVLEDFFIPLHVDAEFELIVGEPQNQFSFSKEEPIGRLSYSTYI